MATNFKFTSGKSKPVAKEIVIVEKRVNQIAKELKKHESMPIKKAHPQSKP